MDKKRKNYIPSRSTNLKDSKSKGLNIEQEKVASSLLDCEEGWVYHTSRSCSFGLESAMAKKIGLLLNDDGVDCCDDWPKGVYEATSEQMTGDGGIAYSDCAFGCLNMEQYDDYEDPLEDEEEFDNEDIIVAVRAERGDGGEEVEENFGLKRWRNFPCSVLPMGDTVFFPGMIAPLFISKSVSVKRLKAIMEKEEPLCLLTQKFATKGKPKAEDLYTVGCICKIIQMYRTNDGAIKILVEGFDRAKIISLNDDGQMLKANIKVLDSYLPEKVDKLTLEGLMSASIKLFADYFKGKSNFPHELVSNLNNSEDAGYITDTIASYISLKVVDSQHILEELNIYKRLDMLWQFLEREIELLNAERQIRSRVHDQLRKNQKDYYLNEQLKAIYKELGGEGDFKSELYEMGKALDKKKMPKEAKDKVKLELQKLKTMAPVSAEATVLRNYIECVIDLPWSSKSSKLSSSITEVETFLNKTHYGLKKVKEAIFDQIAVQMRVGANLQNNVLCLVGPPGVGKTSLARSIANALKREFVRVSLGGVRDEAEIRGHRRTYIGAMPGRIIGAMRRTGVDNPLILLDEIDKMASDWRGDPSAALLEVLDPEQNKEFNDHYLELDYDLSKVLFIATANSISDIPSPLLDRMEVIRLSGYTYDEKFNICQKHIMPKLLKRNGIKPNEVIIEELVIKEVINCYTREAGVRELERSVDSLIKKALRHILENRVENLIIKTADLQEYLGPIIYTPYKKEDKDLLGACTGLAWMPSGGDILHIETVMSLGRGGLKITGKLGDVMQESVQTALSCLMSNHYKFGISAKLFDRRNFHVHVPEGAIPKDGPSAGITIFTALLSLLTKIPVRSDIAMTGEVTLRGHVLPIGGLKEKVLAALRYGIYHVIIPADNKKDLKEIPEHILSQVDIIPVEDIYQVIEVAMTSQPQPKSFDEKFEEEEFFRIHQPSNEQRSKNMPV